MPSRACLVLLCLPLLALRLGAQNTSGSAGAPLLAAPGPATGRISGTVMCGDTRKPARGALILISPLPNLDGSRPAVKTGGRDNMVRVGMDGTYTAEHLAPGDYSVIGVFAGYLTPFDKMVGSQMRDASPAEQRALFDKQSIITLRGAQSEVFNLTLERGAAISGRVLYSDGSPASQVSIDLEDTAMKAKPGATPEDSINVGRIMRAMFTQQTLSTDDQGRFRVAGVPAGTYRVAAVQSLGRSDLNDNFGMFGSAADTSALHFYSGDTLRRKAAKTYELRAGDEVNGLEITIPDRAFHRVGGRLSSVAGRPVSSAVLTLADSSDDLLAFTGNLTDEGSFVFPTVPPGTYTLTVKDAAYNAPFPTAPPAPGKPFVPAPAVLFGPATLSVLVKDSDVLDLSLTVTELPPEAQPRPGPPVQMPED